MESYFTSSICWPKLGLPCGFGASSAEPIDALPAVRIDGKVAPSVQSAPTAPLARKVCAFLCGRAYSEKEVDPVTGVAPCRWAYKNGDGYNCWYCEREFATETTDLSREEFQQQLGRDGAKLERWRARGDGRVAKMKVKHEKPSY